MLLAREGLHRLREQRVLTVVQHHAQLVPHAAKGSSSVTSPAVAGRGDAPGADEDTSREQGGDRSLVLLDRDREFVGFVLPAVLLHLSDGLELVPRRVDALAQTIDVVRREAVVADE